MRLTWGKPQNPFRVERFGFPIEDVWLKDSVSTGIQYNTLTFPLWEAAIAAGATLDELERIESGAYSIKFQAKLIAWHQKHKIVKMHEQDAVARATERKAKRASG